MLASPHPALDDLLRERAAIHPIRAAVPHLWALLDAQIARRLDPSAASAPMALSTSTSSTASTSSTSSASSLGSAAAPVSASSAAQQPQPGLLRAHTAPLPALKRAVAAPRRRIKIPVPADKYPDYNFVGRLLGPRGTTLKTLERDTRCKIMIRGKGSIRKDKEPDVRGKPGWEHVFNEPLHVVIELADQQLDEPAASTALHRARDAVEFLLVPVPEERDALKRQQLRALAIMNGTYRGAPARSMDHLPLPSYTPHQPSPSAASPSHSLSSFADHLAQPAFLRDAPMSAHNNALPSAFDLAAPSDDHSFHHHAPSPRPPRSAGPHASHPNLAFGADFATLDRLRTRAPSATAAAPHGRRSPPSGATSPPRRAVGVPHELSALTASLQRCGMDDLTTSSVEDTPSSSRSSDDGTYPSGGVDAGSFGAPSTHVKVSSISPPPPRADTSLGVGGFIGREFYNGAFSNNAQSSAAALSCQSPWDRPTAGSPAPASSPSAASLSGLFALNHHNSSAPSTEVLTSSMSTVTPIERHYDGY